MSIVVFGANGRVGQIVVRLLLSKEYSVVAFVHGSNPFDRHPRLRVIKGDIRDSVQVSAAIQGSEAVISALGSWGTKTKDIQVSGMNNIIPAMENNSVKRIISLTGSDAYVSGDSKGLLFLFTHVLLSRLAGKILHDGEQHIDLLKNSSLDWSVLRSPVMNDKGDSGEYILTNKRSLPWSSINRKSVAIAMIQLLEVEEYIDQSPFIKRA